MVVMGFSLEARYYSIESHKEFNRRIDDFDFSLVCLMDSDSKAGKVAKEAMMSLASSHDFRELLHDRFGFLFVRVDKRRNESLLDELGYDGKPLFILFERDHRLKSSTLGGNYTRRSIVEFIEQELEQALEEVKEDVRQERIEKRRYQSRPRVHLGFGTGIYPGYGYYHNGYPYWWHRRYRRAYRPWRHHRRHHGGRAGFYFGISA